MDALKFSTFTNNIHYKSREEAYAALSQPDGPKVAYFVKKITRPMDCQDADVLVGFYSSETTYFRVKIGDTYLPSREILAEHFVFATEDYIVPLLRLVCHNVVLDTDKPEVMYGVFACLPQSDRVLLVNEFLELTRQNMRSSVTLKSLQMDFSSKFPSELPQIPDAIQQTIEGLKSSGFTDFTYDEKTGLSFKSKDGVPINFGPITCGTS
jgi:hypothetical protein